MRVTHHDIDFEVTSEPLVDGPRTVLYDHRGRALTRPIGFRAGPRAIDGRCNMPKNGQRSIDNSPKIGYPSPPTRKRP